MEACKKCFKCGEVKKLTSFYKHSQMSGGHVNKCIDCNKSDVKKHREINIDKINEYDRGRYNKNGHRWSDEYLKSEDYKNSKIESNFKFNEKYPYKKKCSTQVASALRRGFLLKYPCEICGLKNSQGHHGDYNKPLDVIWLCPKHHKGLHKVLIFDEENIRFFDADKIAQDYIRMKKCETKL